MTAPAGGLAAVLAGEQAAVYGYGTAGAALVRLAAPSVLISTVRSGFDAHRASRDALAEAIAATGAVPPAALPAYALPFPLTGVAAVVRFLAGIEDRLCVTAAAAIGQTAGSQRLLAADVLSSAAVRACTLRVLGGSAPAQAITPLPGLPGR